MSATSTRDDLRSNIHRFRIRRPSAAAAAATASESARRRRRRSGSPPPAVGPTPHDVVIPACDRCRTFKKKCSRSFPSCSLCAKTGHECSFSAPAPAPAAEHRVQILHLQARIEWLSRLIDENLLVAGGPRIGTVSTGTDLGTTIRPGLPAAMSGPATVAAQLDPDLDMALGQQAHVTSVDAMPGSVALEGHFEPETRADAVLGGLGAVHRSPDSAIQNPLARTLVDAYFRHIHRAYPFMDKNRTLRYLENLGPAAWPPRRANSTLLFLVMALGFTTLQRSGQMPRHVGSLRFDVPSGEIVQECLSRNDLESIQILVLLALHCLYVPAATSAWAVAGIPARKAMTFGLTRRASNDASLSSMDKELRHRLLWSIYVLDRVMAYSTGLPPALSGCDIDVPLPGLAVEEFASSERQRFASVLQTHRHIIRLRQIEDQILCQALSRKQPEAALLSQHARLAAMKEMRTEIENWYSDGCLLAPVEPDNVPIHTSVAWLSARYYHLLLMLHYPCPFNGFGALVSAPDLVRFVQKHLQSTLVLLQQRQLPLNFVTLARTLPVGVLLIHCLMGAIPDVPCIDEVKILIDVFESFPDHWEQARQAAHVFRQVKHVIVEVSLHDAADTFMQPKSTTFYRLEPLAALATGMMKNVLGKTTCYAIPEFVSVREVGDTVLPSSGSPTDSIQASLALLHDQQTLDDGWGSPQFAFL